MVAMKAGHWNELHIDWIAFATYSPDNVIVPDWYMRNSATFDAMDSASDTAITATRNIITIAADVSDAGAPT